MQIGWRRMVKEVQEMFCPECGGNTIPSSDPIEFEIYGDTVLVRGIVHDTCQLCGEEMLTGNSIGELQKKATDLYRTSHGYLTGEEIKALRNRMGYSQESMEDLIKAGPKSFSRWENGTALQKGPTDVLLRVLDRFPVVLEWLRGSSLAYPQKTIGLESSDILATAEKDRRLVA